MGQLSAMRIKALTEPGRYTDGDGLMLIVKESGAKSWMLRVRIEGERRDIGLGSLNPGQRLKQPISDMTLLKVMRDFELPYTVHGFRSAFRDWVAEETSYPGEIAEAALAHAIPNKVEAAYRRTDFLEKRRALMRDWADFCTAPAA
jgi:integrase